MNRWKRLTISGLIIAAASMSCLAMTALADSREEQEMEALKTAFIGAEETLLDMGKFSAPSAETLGTTAGMSEQELNDNVADYAERMERYYSKNYTTRQLKIEENETLLRDIYKTDISYLVDGGVLDCDLRDVHISDDGDTATFVAYWVSWNMWVDRSNDQNPYGLYQVTVPIEDDSATITMVKEDGCWKLLETDNFYKGEGPSVEEAREMLAVDGTLSEEAEAKLDAYEKSRQIHMTPYATFAEALAAAKTIDGNEINPYPPMSEYPDIEIPY